MEHANGQHLFDANLMGRMATARPLVASRLKSDTALKASLNTRQSEVEFSRDGEFGTANDVVQVPHKALSRPVSPLKCHPERGRFASKAPIKLVANWSK
jgi:hypothetical protein